jgi:hypothetical protein
MHEGRTPAQITDFYVEATRQVRALPGVLNVSVTSAVPWRDGDTNLEFAPDNHVPAPGEGHPRATLQVISPGFFATLGLPLIQGRDFTDADRSGSEPVAIVSETLARQIFPGSQALNHYIDWTDPLLQFAPGGRPQPRRIIGVVPDVDNTDLAPRPTMTVYHSFDQDQSFRGGRMLIETRSDPYPLVQPVTAVIRKLSADQPVERASTLEDIRAEVLSPERLNVVVSSVFAVVALLIAVVGVAGVLAFSVSLRTREFGIRLAVGSAPRHLLLQVIGEGAAMAAGGLALGLGAGFWLAQLVGTVVGGLKMPGVTPLVGSALLLLIAAITAAAIPAARAARVDVMQALRSE